ncbi:toll-like receptor 3 isoform X2 [Hippoglossus stenolepis]|nr:toll-like receptor 3 isoform X2 [Hippoglossus stenolepis]XP_035037734.1 toll-like receptor 3 isoform X2 [Hippoglossus stenolepis]XP_035037743.1 toll-like receptor 3 isoform X2 [Hippoglossus stenolepis]XP_035037751.1 toll-like receptor 3 isoform X2 [Hippoglossus stenolepis]
MCSPRSLHFTWIVIGCSILTGPQHCLAHQKKTSCQVQDGRADCSHLSLSAIPPYLPGNISSLDMSHNRLVRIPPASLNPYQGLLHLDVSYNSVTKLDQGLCQMLPLLQTLNTKHNEVHLLKEEDLSHCTSLIWLNMASNRLKLQGQPFSALKNLKSLDVSMNKLMSAKISSHPQLPNLVTLNLAFNDFTTLKKDDFSFLENSALLQVLDLSSVPLKTLEPGCLKSISGLRTLIMDGSKMGVQVLSKLCSELSGSSIDALSLRKMNLVTLPNTTFAGLQKANLTFLDLSHNSMGKIEEGTFQWLPRLQTLILTDNNIKHVTKATFQGLKSLTKLTLTKALVKSRTSSTPIIDDFSFQMLSALESLMLQGTAFREITAHTFTGLTSLKELDMSWSSCISLRIISNKTLLSLAGSPLRKLNLTATAITRINPGSFSVLGNLTTLLLDLNFIEQTLSGKEFEGLGQIQEIHMTYNHWKIQLSSTSFINVPNLRVLTLKKSLNSTTLHLDQSPFQPLSNLTYLDLSNNNIANIRQSMLKGLENLKVLKLPHNNFARLWKDANPGGPVLFLEGAEKLTTLWMDNNGLDEIPQEALRGLTNLRELSLSNNLLNSLKDSVFDDLKSLQVLRLQKNLITAVKPEVFGTPMRKLSLLVIDKNPFDCTCESILWFVTWLNSTNMTIVPDLSDQYMCNTPLAYFNHSIMQFDTLSCKDNTPFYALYLLSSTTVLMLMVTALFVRFHGWRIQFYWNILVSRTLGFSDASVEEGREFEYDAYIIHAERDARWVERVMVPLENENCKFYLEDRDAVPGVSLLQSIMENMRRSRKIVFVVTESLLRDPWCRRFTAHQALHQVIEASRDSVVLVFLQDVHDYKLSRALFLRRGMLRPRCILDWPEDKERVPAFHQKLLMALGMTNRFRD